jgi:hypothetical protein
MPGNRISWRAQEDALDDEEQEARAADRDRQIGDADREEGEVGDGVVPGHLDQFLAPYGHEARDQRHQKLDKKIEQPLAPRRQLFGEIRDVHVQIEPVSRRRADEGQHDGEQDCERFGPRRRAVEHIAGEHRPGNDRRDQYQGDDADEHAQEIEKVHRAAK